MIYEIWKDGIKYDEIWFNGHEYTEAWALVDGQPTLVWKKGGGTPVIGEWYTLSGLTERMGVLTYGDGQFVALGENTYGILADGSNQWVVGNHNLPSYVRALAYGNGVYVAVGSNGIYTSADGMNWTYKYGGQYSNVAYGNGVFIAIAGYSMDASATSSDGNTWTANNMVGSLYGIAYGEDIFVSAGYLKSCYTTDDGTTVTYISGLGNDEMFATEYGNGIFVSAGAYGMVKSFKKGDSAWTSLTGISTNGYDIKNLLYVANSYIATWLDYGRADAVISKDNCQTWQTFTVLGDVLAYGNNRVVAIHSSSQRGESGAFDITYT